MSKRAKNEGSIYQRKSDKRWVVQYHMPGKDKPIIKYCKTESEAVAKLKELVVADSTKTYIENSKITISEWLAYWMPEYIQGEVSENWYARKLDLIRVHIDPEIGHLQMQKATATDIKNFYRKLASSGNKNKVKNEAGERVVTIGLAPGSIKHIHNILKPAFRKAVEEDIIGFKENPMDKVKPPRIVRTRKPKTLDEEGIAKYLAALSGQRLYAAYVLDLCTGIRRGELLGVHRTDFNRTTRVLSLERQIIRVRQPEGGSSLEYGLLKTEKSERSLILPWFAVDVLDEHLARQEEEKRLAGPAYQDEGLIFCTALGKKLDTRRLYELHCRALKKAGLEHMAFHDLRHTFATLMLERGEDIKTIQELLGHADVSTSANTYTHVLKKLKAASADRMDGVMADAMKIAAAKSEEPDFEEAKTDSPRLRLVVDNSLTNTPDRVAANLKNRTNCQNKLSK